MLSLNDRLSFSSIKLKEFKDSFSDDRVLFSSFNFSYSASEIVLFEVAFDAWIAFVSVA